MAESSIAIEKTDSQLGIAEGDRDDQDAVLGPRKGNIFGSSANLVKSIIGSGVLGLPRAFSVSGWLLSLVVLAVSAVINALGLHYICKCGEKLNDRTANYGRVAEATSKWLAPVADFFVFFNCLGACVSYLIIAGDSFPMFIQGVTGMEEGFILNRQLWISIIFVALGVPLTAVKNINFLSYFAAFAIIFIWYIAILVVVFYFNPGPDALNPCLGVPEGECVGEVVAVQFSPVGFIKTMPTFVFALGCSAQVLPVFNELKNPTMGRMNTIILTISIVTMAIYSAVGVFGYLTYGDKVSSNILNNYPTESIPATVGRFCIGVSVAVSYPLYSHPTRQSLMHTVELLMEIQGKGDKVAVGTKFNKILYWTCSFLVLGTTYVLAMFVSDLGIVFDLIGSIGSATLNFTLPGIFFFFMFRGDANALYRGVAIFLAVFGACFSVLGTWLTFV